MAEVRVRICDHALPSRILMQIKKVSRATQSKWDDKETICQNTKPKKETILYKFEEILKISSQLFCFNPGA